MVLKSSNIGLNYSNNEWGYSNIRKFLQIKKPFIEIINKRQ